MSKQIQVHICHSWLKSVEENLYYTYLIPLDESTYKTRQDTAHFPFISLLTALGFNDVTDCNTFDFKPSQDFSQANTETQMFDLSFAEQRAFSIKNKELNLYDTHASRLLHVNFVYCKSRLDTKPMPYTFKLLFPDDMGVSEKTLQPVFSALGYANPLPSDQASCIPVVDDFTDSQNVLFTKNNAVEQSTFKLS